MRRHTLPLTIVLMMCYLPFANGQDQRRAQRRALVEDLLKGLIESQIEKAAPGQPPSARPNNPVRPDAIPSRPGVTGAATAKMLETRQSLQNWSQANGRLIQELRHHEYEAPQLRPLLADSLKIQANIEFLVRKSQLHSTIDPLLDDFSRIDRDWRVLSHRLKQTRGLPNKCMGFIDSIATLDTQLCGVFSIQPQIDRRELIRLATKLSSDFDHLLQDVYYLLRGQPGGRETINQGKQLQAMIAQSVSLIGRGTYDEIANAYRQSTVNWKGFSRKLSKIRDERLKRSIAEIETTGRLIHEQLWLPVEIDRDYLAGMANQITEDANQVFNSISLTQLMSARQPGIVLAAAREFQHACVNFSNGVSSGAVLEDLEWDFRLFEVQWIQVHDLFHEFHIATVDRRLEDIQFSMDTLKQTFGDVPPMDPVMLGQLMANLDALCRQTSRDVHARCIKPRYDDSFHDVICDAADKLSGTTSGLYQRILRQPNSITSANDLSDLFIQWRTLTPLINQCQPQDKLALNQYRSQIEPLMVKLQVVFAD